MSFSNKYTGNKNGANQDEQENAKIIRNKEEQYAGQAAQDSKQDVEDYKMKSRENKRIRKERWQIKEKV